MPARIDPEREKVLTRIRAKQVRERKELDAYCATHGLYWLQNVTKTYDEQAAMRGVPAYKPFPKHDYFKYAWWVLTHPDRRISGRIMFPKSREMMTSWLIAGYLTWFCEWHESALALVQTQSEEKVKKLLTYTKSLYDNQPDWMRVMHPLVGGSIDTRDNQHKTTSHQFLNGSTVQGVPGGARQIPLYHPAIVVFDEAAHLTEAQQAYDFASPAAVQIIGISSAGPGWFASICDDECMDAEESAWLAEQVKAVDFKSLEF